MTIMVDNQERKYVFWAARRTFISHLGNISMLHMRMGDWNENPIKMGHLHFLAPAFLFFFLAMNGGKSETFT